MERFKQLKINEEELNHSFIDIYNLKDEILWNEYKVLYKIYSDGMINSYEVAFAHNGIYHYYKVESVTNYEITTLMNSLFS